MKSCPSCHRTYEDDAMSYCLEDGTPLIGASASSYDPGATIKIPAPRLTNQAPTEVLTEEATLHEQAPKQPVWQPVTPAQSVPSERKRNTLPLILGAVILGLSAIAVAWIVTRSNAPDSSQTVQKTVQSENASPATESSAEVNKEAAPVAASVPTPASDISSKGQVNITPEQASATPKPASTPSPRTTPSSTPGATPEPTPVRPRAPIAGGVLNGKATSLPKPAYPAIARAANASGTVTVQVTIDESGKVISAHAVGGHPLLQQAAVQAAYGARFTPTQLSGQPVKVTGVITYNFVAQ
jgi:protein TonB